MSGGRTFYISTLPTGTAPESGAGWNQRSMLSTLDDAYFPQPVYYSSKMRDSDGSSTSGLKMFLLTSASGIGRTATLPFTGDAEDFETMRSASGGWTAFCINQDFADEGDDIPEGDTTAHFFGWYRESSIRFRLEGLDPNALYKFSFAGQFVTNTAEKCYTRYTVNGTTLGSDVLDVINCTNRVASIPYIAPWPDGTVEVTVAPDAANTFWKRFGCISAVKVEEMDLCGEIFFDVNGSPTSPTWTWNSVNLATENTYNNLKKRNGVTSSVGLRTVNYTDSKGGNSNATLPLTGDAAEFYDAVANGKQYYFSKNTPCEATVFGLDPDCTYTFTFVASRVDSSATKKYYTKYSVTGENSGSATLDLKNNESEVARVAGIRPDAQGEAVISIAPGEGNSVSYTYIAAFKIARDDAIAGAVAVRVVDVKATAGGSVTATVDGVATNLTCYLPQDKTLVATAVPDPGFRFVGWTSSYTNAMEIANPFSISAANHAGWTAVFEKDAAYSARKIYIDALGTPAADTNIWNQLGRSLFSWGGTLDSLCASDGSATPVVLGAVSPFGLGHNGNVWSNSSATPDNVPFTGEAADFEAARNGNSQIYAIINSDSITNAAIVAFDVKGLVPDRAYTFRFAAARSGTSYYETIYRGIGQNRVASYFVPNNNTNRVATVANVLPDASGTVRLEMLSGPAHGASSRYIYLLGLSIEGDIPYAPEMEGRRILWFGNSFSQGGPIPDLVEKLAVAAGRPRPTIVKSLKGGKDVAYHVKSVETNKTANVEAPEIMRAGVGNWDDVVIQGYSTEATHLKDPANEFIPNTTNLYALVRNSAKGDGVRCILYQTWARATGHDFYPDKFATPYAMQAEIVANYNAAADLIRENWGPGAVKVAPVGRGFGLAGHSPQFYADELYHASSPYGYSLAAMTLYKAIYGSFADDDMTYAQAAAANATSLPDEAQWRRIAALVREAYVNGTVFIFR